MSVVPFASSVQPHRAEELASPVQPPLRLPRWNRVVQRGRRRLGPLTCRAQQGRWGATSQQVGVAAAPPVLPPPPGAPPPQAAAGSPSWFSVLVVVGASVTTLAGGLVVFVLHLRPVLKAAERAAAAAEVAARQMEVAALEMEKTARVMQEDMPLTFQDMQRTSKEFEILGKQLNYLTGAVVKPVREPVQWVGKAAETTTSTVQSVTSGTYSNLQRVVDDIKTLANSLTPTITQVRNQLTGLYSSGSSKNGGGASQQRLDAAAAPAAAANGAAAESNSSLLARAASVALQAEAAARDVNVSRRQADAQRWIANWRSRSRGNRKAAAAAAAADAAAAAAAAADAAAVEATAGELLQEAAPGMLARVGQLFADGVLAAEHEAAAAAVFAALERAQRAAEEAASASGALEAAIKKAEDRGALPSMDSSDEDEYEL